MYRYALLLMPTLVAASGAFLFVFTAGAIDKSDPVLVGAGDIARCRLGTFLWGSGADATASLLDGIEGIVFTAGDNVYEDGTAHEFRNCYGSTWGRHRARTRPSPGNHDYRTAGAVPYYTYFGKNAGPPGRGYYSYYLGAWHIVSLNSNIPAEAGSEQERWLRADLRGARNPVHARVLASPRIQLRTPWQQPAHARPLDGALQVWG
jgi:acid phosphatase type 7